MTAEDKVGARLRTLGYADTSRALDRVVNELVRAMKTRGHLPSP